MCKFMKNKAFGTIELIVAISIFAFLFVSLFSAVYFLSKLSLQNKAQILAQNIANAEFEKLRAMDFESIKYEENGGLIKSMQTKTVSSINYNIQTEIFDIDDNLDLKGVNDKDSNSSDYKAVYVTVTWSLGDKNFSIKRFVYVYGR